MAKLPHGIEKIEALKYDARFPKHVNFLQEDGTMSNDEIADAVMSKFGIKTWLRPVMVHFLETGEIDGTLADPPVRLYRECVLRSPFNPCTRYYTASP